MVHLFRKVLNQSADFCLTKWSLYVRACVCVCESGGSAVSVTGTVLSTSAAFNCLLSTCGAIYAPFEQTFAFHASGLV